MALTGRADGAPLAAPGRPAAQLRVGLERFARLVEPRTGARPDLPGIGLLGERAALAGFHRAAPWSCGGAFQALRTADGWLGLSLARPSDREAVPALVESSVDADPWSAVAAWAAGRPGAVALERVRLLGLAGALVPSVPPVGRAPVVTTPGGRRPQLRERPLVVDLTSLWAGPLCAHLLGLGGADIVKVESSTRPDGARGGPAAFFDVLHAGHAMVALELSTAAGREALGRLIARADLVLESSRARALRQLGIDAEQTVADGTSWLSITAYGRDVDAIGFGDDVAAGAGLVVWEGDEPLPCGDAIADPLAGVAAAEAAAAALLEDRAQLIDVSMQAVASAAAVGPAEAHRVVRLGADWWVESAAGDFRVEEPRGRTPDGRAHALGADTTTVQG